MKMKQKKLNANLNSKYMFQREKKETWKSRFLRWKINRFRAFRGTGGKIIYLHPDLNEVHLKLPLNKKTVNTNGTIFGGSMYGAVEWFPPILIMLLLGPEYIAWNKESRIKFLRPGTDTLYARFQMSSSELIRIRTGFVDSDKVNREYKISLIDKYKTVCAIITVLIQIKAEYNG